MKSLVRLGCNLAIHIAQAFLDTLDGRRPMIDEPLPDGLDRVYTGPFEDCGMYGPVLAWGMQADGDGPYCPRNDVPSDERVESDHGVTLGRFRP